MFYRVAYTSRATVSPALVIHDIISACRHHNDVHGITGLLLCDGSRYVQAIEGDEAVVRHCAERIFADPRHSSQAILQQGAITSRQFGAWSLNRHLQPSSATAHAYTDAVMKDVAEVTDAELKAFFVGFAALARGAGRVVRRDVCRFAPALLKKACGRARPPPSSAALPFGHVLASA